jgi:hypothetical protein
LAGGALALLLWPLSALLKRLGWEPKSFIRGERIRVPEFEVVSNPQISLTEIKQRRFNIIDRAQDLARKEIQVAEDERVFAMLNVAK